MNVIKIICFLLYCINEFAKIMLYLLRIFDEMTVQMNAMQKLQLDRHSKNYCALVI